MKKLTTILVDDEQDSRECLAQYLNKYCPSVELLATCTNIQEAKVAIDKHSPQPAGRQADSAHSSFAGWF